MSPLEIRNSVLYLDRTVQDWHRRHFHQEDDAFDLDLYGACHVCRDPLYLIESSTNPDKTTTATRKLAVRANCAAFLILHSEGNIVGGRKISPVYGRLLKEAELIACLDAIRDHHMKTQHSIAVST